MRKVRICHCSPTNPFAVPFAKAPAVVLCWLLLMLPAPAPLQAQTGHSALSLPAHRCLIIVETSRAMVCRAPGTYAALKVLLDSDLKGQLRRSDTINLWTFNESLHTNQFEPWSPQTQLAYAVRLSAFRDAVAYEKRASLDKVLPEMERVIRKSEFITVILVSTGEELMRGTPFDDRINEACKQWRDEQRKARMPFVTLLQARHGRFTDWSVTPAPWPVELPPLAAEPEIVVEGHMQTTAPVLVSAPQPVVKQSIPSPVSVPVEPVSMPASDRAPAGESPVSPDPAVIRAETQKTGPVAPQPAPARESEITPAVAVAPAAAHAISAESQPPQPSQPAAKSGDEKDKPVETPQAPQSFIRENAVWLVIGTVSGIAAVYLLLTWRLIYVRPRAGSVSILQPRKGEKSPPPKV
jgi:hypothetical protein